MRAQPLPSRADLDRVLDMPIISDDLAATKIIAADRLKPNMSESDVIAALVECGVRLSHTSGDLGNILRLALRMNRARAGTVVEENWS